MPTYPLAAATLMAALALAAPSQAARYDAPQSSAKSSPQPERSDNPVSIPVTPAEARAEVELTQRLNREQAEFAQRQLAANAAARRANEQAEAERAAIIARQQREHAEAFAEHEAEREQRAREHAEAMAHWRADVAACKAGDISRCAPREPQP